MKYFFLAEGWTIARVWDATGVWNGVLHRRQPSIERVKVGIVELGESFWLYRVEAAVVMVEVKPERSDQVRQPIGQVVLKRLIDATEVIERLSTAEVVFNGDRLPGAPDLSQQILEPD